MTLLTFWLLFFPYKRSLFTGKKGVPAATAAATGKPAATAAVQAATAAATTTAKRNGAVKCVSTSIAASDHGYQSARCTLQLPGFVHFASWCNLTQLSLAHHTLVNAVV